MKIPSNAFALFLCLATIATSSLTKTKTNAFVVRPTINGRSRTALGYIKEDYNTGIGPDILRKQRQKHTAPPVDPIVENEIDVDGYIDAVVIEEDFHYDRTSTIEDEDEDEDKDKDGATQLYEEVVETMKREMFDTKPKDVFPDIVEDPAAASTPSIWDTNTAETIHGGSLRTWSMESPEVDYTQVMLKSTHWDNPLQAQIDVWNGPGHAPMKLAVYSAPTTSEQPLSFVIPTPGLNQQSIGVKNSGPLEFPMKAVVIGDVESAREQRKRQRQQSNPQPQGPTSLRDGGYAGFYESIDPTSGRGASREKVTSGLGLFAEKLRDLGEFRKIEGIAPVQYATADGKKGSNEKLFEFDKNVDSVQVLIETSGLSCQARIEVTSDCDGEIQHVVELSVEDGKARPFFAVLDTSRRSSTSVRVINLDPYSAFPITACVEPYTIRCDQDSEEDEDNVQNDTHDLDFIDASIEDEEEMGVGTIIDGAVVNEKEEYLVYNVQDLTIPESLADYDFDEEFFFAS
mmetsp:Transcript_27723/g.75551  ORF Transcript_27723/g.75551 Transcript_27723/m.75551 type:complete len:515 (-) Transcript_27723:501-2045(-)